MSKRKQIFDNVIGFHTNYLQKSKEERLNLITNKQPIKAIDLPIFIVSTNMLAF